MLTNSNVVRTNSVVYPVPSKVIAYETIVANYHQDSDIGSQDTEFFHPKDSSHWPFTAAPTSLPPSLLPGDHKSVLVLYNVLSRMIFKWNYGAFWHWLFFTQYNFLESHPGCCVDKYFIIFLLRVVFHGINIPGFVYSPIEGQLHCFRFGAFVNRIGINIHVQDCEWT